MFNLIAKKIFGSVNERVVKKIWAEVEKINDLEGEIAALSDADLRAKTDEFKKRLKDGEKLDNLLHEAFAVVREAAKRVLGMRHFDVQLIGGIVLHRGMIAEMKTGEGKTLVSTLPCYLNALTGQNVHVVTVNDYLAKRDAAWMGQVHEFLGLSVGCITNDLGDEQRKAAYACDITYATNNELGFDYLRDNMKYDADDMASRGHFFAIVDEVDSILVDEARTPLVISGPTDDNSELYEKINKLIPELSDKAFQIEEKERSVFLTDEGTQEMEEMLKKQGVIEENASLYDIKYVSYVHHINQALKAHKVFKAESDYIVKDGAVVIIDEFTGRMQEGRRFSDGLHQALEAKEGVRVRNENQTLASITFQNYFRLYDKLAGMTGTAATEAVEFEEIYGLKVVEVPTNVKIARVDEDDEIYKTENAKNEAIIASIKEAHAKKQPILVGTTSIDKSEKLSRVLKKHKLPHEVLNAKYHAKEAAIVAQAGRPGAITIATNMAGRGTDIVLGGKEEEYDSVEEFKRNQKIVLEAGGLYVLGCERHESRRIDNQLRGRSGRQGDVGRSKFFLSLEDDLMRIFGSQKLQTMLSRLGLKDDEAIFHPWITRTLQKAQQKVEMRNYEIRKNLLKYDDVVNYQRKNIFELRKQTMAAKEIAGKIKEMALEINEDLVGRNIPKNSYLEKWDLAAVEAELKRIYGLDVGVCEFAKENVSELEILDFVNKETLELFEAKEKIYGAEILRKVEKQIFLITLDSEWKDHLLSLDKLRNGINLRAYAQKDPLIEYKKDAFELFEDMMLRLEEQVVSRVAHVQIGVSDEELEGLRGRALGNVTESRNDPGMPFSEARMGVGGVFENSRRGVHGFSNTHPEGLGESSRGVLEPVRSNVAVEDRDPGDPSSWGNVGRNEACPCGSGKKFKKCHG